MGGVMDDAGIRAEAAALRRWLDGEASARKVSGMEAWERALSSREGISQDDARRVLSAGLAMEPGSGFPEDEIAPLRDLLRDALRSVCDGTYGDDTSCWTLEVGPGTGMDVEALVDSLARRLHPGIPSLAQDRDGELRDGPRGP